MLTRYGRKRAGIAPPAQAVNPGPRRRCVRCRTPLEGKRGHGFVDRRGIGPYCGRKDSVEVNGLILPGCVQRR